jgi:hypothetical protein
VLSTSCMDGPSKHCSPARRLRNCNRRVRHRLNWDIHLFVQSFATSQVSVPPLKLLAVPERSLLTFDPFDDAGDSYGTASEHSNASEHIAASASTVPVPASPLMDFLELSLMDHPLGKVLAGAVADVCALACSFTQDFILGFTRSLRGMSERASLLKCWASYHHFHGSCHCFESTFVDESISHFHRDSLLLEFWGDSDFYYTIRFAGAFVKDIRCLCRQLRRRLSSPSPCGRAERRKTTCPKVPVKEFSLGTSDFFVNARFLPGTVQAPSSNR